MLDSKENATPPKHIKSRISPPSVTTQMKPKSQFEYVSRDTEESDFLGLVDFGGVVFSAETVRGHIYVRPQQSAVHWSQHQGRALFCGHMYNSFADM